MLKNMSKRNIVIIIVIVLIVVGVAFYINKVNKNKGYSVIYLSTGEIYVGKLCTFPYLKLTDGYVFVATKDDKDPTKNNFQLNPMNETLWAPKSLHLVKKNIIFYGKLNTNSKIAQTLAGVK